MPTKSCYFYGLVLELNQLLNDTKDERYPHERKRNCTHIEAHLVAAARSSPKRRLTGFPLPYYFTAG